MLDTIGSILSPLDYPRQSAYGLGNSLLRAIRGEADTGDIAAALPGVIGLGAGIAGGPLAGLLAAGVTQGIGKLAGTKEAPTSAALVEALGGDPGSLMQTLPVQMATDPMTFLAPGALRQAARVFRPAAPVAAAAASPLAEAMATGPRAAPIMTEIPSSPMWQSAPALEEARLGKLPAAAAPYARAPVDEATLLAGRQAAMEQDAAAQVAAQAAAEARAALPPLGPLPLGEGGGAALFPGQQHRGNVGMLGDMMSDMFGKGYATPQERMAIAAATEDVLQNAQMARAGGALPRLTPQELSHLMTRDALARAEQTMAPLSTAEGSSALGQLAGGQLEGDVRGAMSLPELMQRRFTYHLGSHYFPEGALDAQMLGRGVEMSPAVAQMSSDQLARAAALSRSQATMMANARLASPDLRLAEQMARGAEQVTSGRISPEAGAALVEQMQRYGIPINPESVSSGYSEGVRSLRGLAGEVARSAARDAGPEALNTYRANELLRILGPERFQRFVSGTPAPGPMPVGRPDAYNAGKSLAESMIPELQSELLAAMQARGLL